MSDWSISKSIAVLSAVLVGAMLIAAAAGMGATLRLASVFASFKDTAGDSLVVAQAEDHALAARGFELWNRFSRDSETAARAEAALADFLLLEEDIAQIASEDPEGRVGLVGLADDIREYRRLFAETLAAQQTIDASAEAATGHGTALATHLDTLIAEASMDFETLKGASKSKELGTNAIMSYRTAIIEQSAESFEELRLALEESTAALDAVSRRLAGSRRAAATEALAALAAFGEQATLKRDAIQIQIAARERLDALSNDVQQRIRDVRDVEVARQTDLAERASGVVTAMLSILAVVSIAAVAGGTLFAMSTQRRIGATIAGSVDVMQELASGNLEVEIAGGDKDHELGRMARALEVFRTNAVAAKEAEARQKEQERLQRERDAERDRREAETTEAQRRASENERREVVRRLQTSIGEVVDGAAAGDFSRRITDRFAEEEFNRMAEGINRLMSNVETGVTEVARVMSRVAAGDLTERVGGDLSGLLAELQANVNETIDTLARIVDDIAEESIAVVGDVVAMAGQSDELARRAEQQAASLEETTAAMEEISATTRSASEGATAAGEFAARTTGRVDEAGRVVATAVEAMDGIRKASSRIGEIVSVIDGIAFQTNLLALNASVEAARAGSAGKGFAVVATEVRALAQRSGSASQDIRALIDESSAKVAHGVSLVEQTGATLQEVVEGVRGMADALRKLVTTGKEQAAGIQEVSSALAQLDVITQKNASLADQTREQTTGVKRRTESMRELVASFRTRSSQTRAPSLTSPQPSSSDASWEEVA